MRSLVPPVVAFLVHQHNVVQMQFQLKLAVGRIRHDAAESTNVQRFTAIISHSSDSVIVFVRCYLSAGADWAEDEDDFAPLLFCLLVANCDAIVVASKLCDLRWYEV